MKLDRLSPEESRSSPTGQPRLKEIESKNKPTIQEAVASALQSLPMRTRSALELRSIGFTPLEVAWILNMSGKNANVLIHEGREVLSRHLAGLAGEALE
jgi:DNA-directed RNA polymerase specialized sigma24 family protein